MNDEIARSPAATTARSKPRRWRTRDCNSRLHPLSSVKTAALHRQVDPRHHYDRAHRRPRAADSTSIGCSSARTSASSAIFKTYLENKGLNFQEREILTDCLLDWVQSGGTTHLNGSKTALDGSPAPGRPLQDLSEVRRVVGSGPLTRLSGWENDFTLLSKGPIDLQWASEDVVAAIPGVGQARAHSLVRQRRGPDGIDGTADDVIFADEGTPSGLNAQNPPAPAQQNPQLIAQLLGLNPVTFQAIQDLISTGDTTVRIVSVGQALDAVHTFEVVVRKEGIQPQILSWKEY